VPLAAADRRRHPRATELRRALRESDARLYLQKVAAESVALSVVPRPKRAQNLRAAVACVAAGLLLVGAGEFIDAGNDQPDAHAPAANVDTARDVALPRDPAAELQTARAEPQPAPTDRSAHAPHRSARIARTRGPRDGARRAAPRQRSVLQKLRLNWLRTVLSL